MHNLIVIFAVLLVLLIVISTLGGSIYAKETFDQTNVREMFWDSDSEDPTSEPTMTDEPPVEDNTEHFKNKQSLKQSPSQPLKQSPSQPLKQSPSQPLKQAPSQPLKVMVQQKEHMVNHPDSAHHGYHRVIEGFDGDVWALAN